MTRFLLMGLLLAVTASAVAGCRSAEKTEAVGAAEQTRWKMPTFIYEDNWWGKNEMGGLDR